MKCFGLLLIFPTMLFAAGLSDCGEYTVRGVVRPLKEGVTLVVNEKTQSEMKIKMPLLEQSKLGAFFDKPVTVKALLITKFNGTMGFADQIIEAKFRLPDPLNPNDTGLDLDKKVECKKVN